MTWHPDSRLLASAGRGGGLRVFNALSGELVYALKAVSYDPSHGSFESADWSSDGAWLAVNGPQDGTVRLWEMAYRRQNKTLEIPGYLPNCLAWRPGSHQLAVTAGNNVWIFDVSRRSRRKLAGSEGTYTTLAWRPDGATLAVGLRDGAIRLYEVTR